MTPEQARNLLPVIIAFSEGKKVQLWSSIDDEWVDAPSPTFSTACKWRIKPNPDTDRKAWVERTVALMDGLREARSHSQAALCRQTLLDHLNNHPDTMKEK